MVTKINTHAWRKLITENREWLAKQPRSLEREHIDSILQTCKAATVIQYEKFATTVHDGPTTND